MCRTGVDSLQGLLFQVDIVQEADEPNAVVDFLDPCFWPASMAFFLATKLLLEMVVLA